MYGTDGRRSTLLALIASLAGVSTGPSQPSFDASMRISPGAHAGLHDELRRVGEVPARRADGLERAACTTLPMHSDDVVLVTLEKPASESNLPLQDALHM